MASVVVLKHTGNGIHADIDYSILDGRVRSFVLDDCTLYDEQAGVAADGWLTRLRAFIHDNPHVTGLFRIWLEQQL